MIGCIGSSGRGAITPLLSVFSGLFLVWASAVSVSAAEVPLPPPRPISPEPSPTGTPKPNTPEAASAETPAIDIGGCLDRLKKAGFGVEHVEPPKTGNQLCRIDEPVRLISVPVATRPGRTVSLAQRPILACAFAENFGQWIGELAAAAISGSLGSDLLSVSTGPGFECRNRNGSPSGKLSAHAEGEAIDISSFDLADGSKLEIKPGSDGRRNQAMAVLRKAACGWFTTILGPGSDPAHTDHLHVDIQKHGSSDRYRICE
ncbi:extensin-like domain-containing protein [Microvirga puerhi]|uniref:Extensin family protein n=1 Tax=Microvirga puerhi TaxID=2876078 RepID=A0ABS7VHY3_9HYPH|nr:extensin family protein [Microvirga puerhi]